MANGTIAVTLLSDLAVYLGGRGLNSDPVLEAAGLTAEAAADPDHRVPFGAMQRAWAAAETLTGDPDVGLHSAEHPRVAALGLLGYVLLTSPNIGEAIAATARWFTLLNSGLRFRCEALDGAVMLSLSRRHGETDLPRHFAEAILLGTARHIDLLSGRSVPLRDVAFAHPAPKTGVTSHLRCFGVPVRFGVGVNRLTYAADVLGLPIRTYHPSVRTALAAQAEALAATLDGGEDVVSRVRRCIQAGLRGRAPSIADVGRELAMSTRSLQRNLRESGTSFQQLLDDVRREIATSALRSPGTTASEVGALLGFVEPASFTRAFRRWTGEAPSVFTRRSRQPQRD